MPSQDKISKLNVLVIDDDVNVANVIKEMLAIAGYDVTTINSAHTAIDEFKKNNYNVVFTDLGLPDMNGWEVAKNIKSINPNVPVILVTGWGAQISSNEIEQSSVDMVLSKPFKLDQLIVTMQKAIKLNSF